MKCPVDGELLAIANRGKIEIDYCPSCRGVWLDRGELDKIIDESSLHTSRPHKVEERYERDTRPQEPHHKKRRENFLGDLFDF